MIEIKINDLDWNKMEGLIPVITQDAKSHEVLTLAFVNQEALEMSIKTGWAYYYRRTHGRVMKKGETSGNFQRIKEILVDCDNDSIIYLVDPMGPACHLGERTCFHKKIKI